ncbi:MAG: hypothetical protein ABI315_06125 [Bacteroidia bacterium]
MKENNLLASVALFGELYNNEKYKSISDIIAEFIKGAVVYENKFSFNSTELTALLDKVYGFKIPESVIRTTLNNKLKDIIEKKDGYYHFQETIKNEFQNINAEFDSINSTHTEILNDLVNFVEKKEKNQIRESDKKELFENFNHFLLDNGLSDKYSNHISAFVIINQDKVGFKDSLNGIKEGVILYQGIKYTADINELGKWNTDLTIYLNTEHLFSALGYNGILFQEIFDDFLKLVTEINMSSKKVNQEKRIELKYFEETKTEVDNYFLTAEKIQRGAKQLDPSKSAMKMILDNAKTLSEIKSLRVKFDFDLKLKGITLQEFNHDIASIMRFNVEDEDILEELKKKSIEKQKYFDEHNCRQYFKIFTKVNYFRNGESRKQFEKIGFLFITENRFAKYLAHNNSVKFEENDVPFAKEIDYIITKFWFKLKKGFSDKQSLPKSFDVVTKAKIILSSHLTSNVSAGYHKLLDEIKNGKLTKDEALQRSYEFRERPNRPEEINIENVDSSLEFLNNESYFEDLFREKERKEALLVETQSKNKELQNEINRRDKIETVKKQKLKEEQYDNDKKSYINIEWEKVKRNQNSYLLLSTIVFLLNLTLAISAVILTSSTKLKNWISEFGICQICLILFYALIVVIEIFGSKYIFNKEKLKNGWFWFTLIFDNDRKIEFEETTKKHLDEKYNENHSNPRKPGS